MDDAKEEEKKRSEVSLGVPWRQLKLFIRIHATFGLQKMHMHFLQAKSCLHSDF